MSDSTPAAGAGTSRVTLSVSSSTSGSSTATASPGCLNHLPTVASVTRFAEGGHADVSHYFSLFVMAGLVPAMTECKYYLNASSSNCLSCARCFDICPTAVEAEAGRPA